MQPINKDISMSFHKWNFILSHQRMHPYLLGISHEIYSFYLIMKILSAI